MMTVEGVSPQAGSISRVRGTATEERIEARHRAGGIA